MLKYYLTKKNKWLYELTAISAFLIIALPLYASNGILDYIKLFGTDINIFHILFFTEALLLISTNRKIRIKKFDLIILLFLFIIVFQTIIGLKKIFSMTYLLRDLNMYLLPILIFFVFENYFMRIECSIEDIFTFFLKAITICCTINVIMYLTSSWSFWQLKSYAGDRFGGNYLTAITLLTGFATYELLNKRLNKFFILYFFSVSFLSLILAQSRSNLMIAFILIVITLFVNNFFQRKIIMKKIYGSFLLSIIIVICVLFFINGNSKILERFININNIEQDESLNVRINTNLNNFNLMLNNPQGIGLGAMLNAYDMNNKFLISQNFIDNAFLTIGTKLGLIALAIYIYIAVIMPINFFIKNIKTDKINLVCLISYVFFIFSTMVITCQSIISLSVSSIIWILIAFINKKKEKNEKNEEGIQ